jgi:DNA-nicking Smr family endonuclease
VSRDKASNAPSGVRVTTLADLKQVRQAIAAHAARAEQAAQLAAQRIAQEAQRLAAPRNLFQAAVGAVKRLPESRTANLQPAPPLPTPTQHLADEAAALREALSDDVDITTLLDTDEHLSFRRPGVGMDVVQKLRRGKWAIQRQLDLHGLRSDDARNTLGRFIREAHKQGIRCVRVIHGKGLGSPGKAPVLKDKVNRWLVQKSEVVAFVQAQPSQGGTGAVVVLLQPLHPLR